MAIDGSKIIHAVLEGSRIRESKGIIPLFGVYLSFFPTCYYNRLSFEFEQKIEATRPELAPASLLIKASQACGYATFHGIRTSREWEKIVKPMIDRKEDQIMGFTAVAVAFGWGDLEVRELIPGKILRMRAHDSYEANGYLEDYGIAKSGKCYMLRGVVGGFMDLLYGEDYPDGCFTFLGDESSCRAKGDTCCEFIVQRSSG